MSSLYIYKSSVHDNQDDQMTSHIEHLLVPPPPKQSPITAWIMGNHGEWCRRAGLTSGRNRELLVPPLGYRVQGTGAMLRSGNHGEPRGVVAGQGEGRMVTSWSLPQAHRLRETGTMLQSGNHGKPGGGGG